jgi:DNA invertase Pin-like site-specific DNA recombinase
VTIRPVAYSYVRLSSLRQIDGFGQDRQVQRAKDYAEKHNLDLHENTTLIDLGKSGFKGVNRREGALAGFLEAVKDAKVPSGSYLIIEALDRFSRENVMEALPEFIKLINAGVNIVTLVDGKVHRKEDYHREWTNLIYSMVAFAQANDESAKKQYRQRSNWEKKRVQAEAGEIVTGRIPQWLEIVTDPRGKKRFREIPERVALVRRIFEELAGGIGRGSIAKRLNDRSQPGGPIPPFTKKGDGWHGGTIQKLTTSRTVLGEYQPMRLIEVEINDVIRTRREAAGDPIRHYYPQIISDDLWLRAQRASKARRSLGEGRVANFGGRVGYKYSNLFRQVARCADCGAAMVYRDGSPRGKPYLQCSRHKRRMCDNALKYYYNPLEDAVLEWVHDLDLSDAMPDERRALEGEIASRTLERDGLAAKIRKLVLEFLDAKVSAVADVTAERLLSRLCGSR